MTLIETHIEKHLKQTLASKQSVSTGLFAAYQVKLDDGSQVFIKYQTNANQQLIEEGKSLSLLGKTIHTPKVLSSCEHCLILEWITTNNNLTMQARAGTELALLHQNTQPYFGFEVDNHIGQTPQLNAVGKNINNWAEFYWQYRLLYQIQLAQQNNLVDKDEYWQLLSIENKLPKLLGGNIKPSLLHGDLWSGNLLSGKNHPYFIDPACYYGHHEVDFALSFMFSGFSADFYDSYQAIAPFSEGFDKRKPLYMLYHYLNHLNLFGGGYHGKVINCVRQLNNRLT